ncbi:hypothetical protein NX059_006164 [Plenodomus lindquistii]|nr:hypothetical protein NX059_006164 [Plenodomus lindquistii]
MATLSSPSPSPPLSPSPTPNSPQLQPRPSLMKIHRKLLVTLPLPESLGGPKRTAAPVSTIPTYDRAFWKRILGPVVRGAPSREVISALGLRRKDITARIPQFLTRAVTTLAKEATNLANTLPDTSEELVDAACGDALKAEVEDVLSRFGQQIWGSGTDRPWLLRAREVPAYKKDLYIEDSGDRAVIAHHYRSWILLKGSNQVRNFASRDRRAPALPTRERPAKGKKKVVEALPYDVSAQTKSSTDRRALTAAHDQSQSLTERLGEPQESLAELQEHVLSPMSTLPFPGVPRRADATVANSRVFSQNLPAPLAKAQNSGIPRLFLSWYVHWTEREWHVAKYTAPDIKFALWSHLGLNNVVPTSKLETEVLVVGKRIALQLSTEDCCRCATSDSYLVQDIDILLDEYAPLYWGLDAPGRTIVEKDSPGPRKGKDLVYEDDEDRKMLWLHLHQLIFLDALATVACYDTGGGQWKETDARNLAKLAKRKQCVVPPRTYAPLPVQSEAVYYHGLDPRASIFSVSYGESQRENKGTTITTHPAATTQVQSIQIQNTQHNSCLPHPRQGTQSAPPNSTNLSDLTASLLQYFHEQGDTTFSESTALGKIRYNLITLPPSFRLYTVDFPTVLLAWLDYRHVLLNIHDEVSSLAMVHPNSQRINHDRLLGELRQARRKFNESSDNGRETAEEVLITGFARIEGVVLHEEIARGFQRLREEVDELEVMFGGGKWNVLD